MARDNEQALPSSQSAITWDAVRRNSELLKKQNVRKIELEPRYLIQMAHLTVPATVWKYIEKAVSSVANLVMLDLEDSIPRGNPEMLEFGRANVIRAMNELDWGRRLRFFRPRGMELDPGHEDIASVICAAGAKIDGLVYPKVEGPEEIASVDATLTQLETSVGLTQGSIRIEVLIESADAVELVFDIAACSRRLVGLIFGSYDYWASLGLDSNAYRFDHPLLNYARMRIVQAAAAVGIPAIAEMTTNFPTKDKSEEQRAAAKEEFRRDAILARDYGFAGKWTGIPDQTQLALDVFGIDDTAIEAAVKYARAFLEQEGAGRGAVIIEGKMADRATDRVHRTLLKKAFALGKLEPELARELGLA